MMEASPAAPFVVPEPHLLLEILVVAVGVPASEILSRLDILSGGERTA